MSKDVEDYRAIVKAVSENGGIILNGWVEPAAVRGSKLPDDDLWWNEICKNAQLAIEDADAVIVEASGSSTFGAGYQLAFALQCKKRVLALVKRGVTDSYVRGLKHDLLKVMEYDSSDVHERVRKFILDRGERK